MRTELKLSAILLTLIFTIIPIKATTANATTFEANLPSFGLYCENENAEIHGKVKYAIDESAKAVQFSEYAINEVTDGLTCYIPFISTAYELPKIDLTVNKKAATAEVCYGESFINYDGLRFYSCDIADITGTLYTLTSKSESFTVDFRTRENQSFIYRFTENYTQKNNGNYSYIINNANADIAYEIFVINGDFTEFESNAETVKQTLTAKEYIDRKFTENEDYYSAFVGVTPDLLYALINRAMEKGVNYSFYDFFFDSFSVQRVNAYKIDLQADIKSCTIAYSMPVAVQQNTTINPAIYLVEQTSTGNYSIDYAIELNGGFPYIIESNAALTKQGENVYTAKNITDDFYFVFSSTAKPQSKYCNNAVIIVLCVVLAIAFIALIIFGILTWLRYKKIK